MPIVNGTFVPDFVEADTTPVLFDTGLKIIVGVGTLATLFGLVLAINVIRGRGFTLGMGKKR